jgi:Glycosyltransferase 61
MPIPNWQPSPADANFGSGGSFMRLPLKVLANIRNVRRLFRGAGTLRGNAFEEEVLCAEETSDMIPAIYLPGQLERVTGTPIESNVSLERHLLVRNTATHAATIAYHIRDAVLFEGSIYAGTLKHALCPPPSFPSEVQDRHFQTVALTSSWVGARYFGHWLKDDCLRYLLAYSLGRPLSVMRSSPSNHMKEYADYFSQEWTTTSRGRIDHLVVYQDFSQNSSKKRRYATLQARLASWFPAARSPSLVYLRRGCTGEPRLIQNEDVIIATLTKSGFTVVDVATDSLQHIVGSLMHAQLVVSIEGSHLSHCWFQPNYKSGILALQPPDRFTAIHRSYTECMSAKYGIVVGSKHDSATTCFSPDDILRTSDLMLAQASAVY